MLISNAMSRKLWCLPTVKRQGALPDPGATAPRRSSRRAWVATTISHWFNAPRGGSCGVLAGIGNHSRAARLHRCEIRRLRRQTTQPMCWRVQGLHEGQYRDLQHLMQAARRELGLRVRSSHDEIAARL